jgi:hypothetical protein
MASITYIREPDNQNFMDIIDHIKVLSYICIVLYIVL